jgi:hypothetical protein
MAKRQVLTNLQAARLYPVVEQTYLETGLPDAEFAVKVTDILGFPVSEAQVRNAREQLKVASNNKRASPVTRAAAIERLSALEDEVKALGVIVARHDSMVKMLEAWRLERTLASAANRTAAKKRGR